MSAGRRPEARRANAGRVGAAEDSAAPFDRWAATYDADVRDAEGFPFVGYAAALDAVVERAAPSGSPSVLDLGTGTGNLAARFAARGCPTFGLDFAPAMIDHARAKVPEARFAVRRLGEALPAEFPRRFDRVVSGYAFHHLDDAEKIAVILGLVRDRLRPAGRLVIADVAFPTAADRDAARRRWSATWDATEHYWAADETIAALRGSSVEAAFTPVSCCAGVFVFEPREAT